MHLGLQNGFRISTCNMIGFVYMLLRLVTLFQS